MTDYFESRNGGLCDRCDRLIVKGDIVVRTVDHQLLCERCGQ